ncbi:hypothetical protein FB565_006175 [Actinoplanes lutulentus]|uniref:Uncharacterized protein n=1 Tax=Actinoplanes lutulentus TaxID=1287878 RepID=A0A327YUJ1_9ACTN|nr:hypothetical protein [Actinoplanes lutulentus]RAK24642.1 hypothetical protein B0I29_1395 [Actinoplanes lutulentus]
MASGDCFRLQDVVGEDVGDNPRQITSRHKSPAILEILRGASGIVNHQRRGQLALRIRLRPMTAMWGEPMAWPVKCPLAAKLRKPSVYMADERRPSRVQDRRHRHRNRTFQRTMKDS